VSRDTGASLRSTPRDIRSAAIPRQCILGDASFSDAMGVAILSWQSIPSNSGPSGLKYFVFGGMGKSRAADEVLAESFIAALHLPRSPNGSSKTPRCWALDFDLQKRARPRPVTKRRYSSRSWSDPERLGNMAASKDRLPTGGTKSSTAALNAKAAGLNSAFAAAGHPLPFRYGLRRPGRRRLCCIGRTKVNGVAATSEDPWVQLGRRRWRRSRCAGQCR